MLIQNIIKIIEVQRTPKKKIIRSIIVETENLYRRFDKDSEYSDCDFNWEDLKDFVNANSKLLI